MQGTAHLTALGAALGRLHTLPIDERASLPAAGMLPKQELTWVTGLLAEVAKDVPPHSQKQYERLMTALQTMDRFEDLPAILIHNDCNLGNAILMPSGEVALVDWDSAGLGAAPLDVGILLRNIHVKHPVEQAGRVDHAAIQAFVDGYCRYRLLTRAELQHLVDAVQFMTLVLLAAYFPERIQNTLADDALIYGAPYAAWQAQFDAAEEIAAIAQKRFEQHF
jgi:Ser/Thr protein kinase RdoA (MazF antagonist)